MKCSYIPAELYVISTEWHIHTSKEYSYYACHMIRQRNFEIYFVMLIATFME